MTTFNIAVIAGDGIGKEVVPEGIRVLEAAGRRFDFRLHWRAFDWSCETYAQTGKMLPEDGLRQLQPFNAIFLGAVGHPSVPDHISLWGTSDFRSSARSGNTSTFARESKRR